ncbi:MAG: hypothetical protein ACJ71S_06345 [Acidobacteriaceae bacterium]|jgi:hypothetical protein
MPPVPASVPIAFRLPAKEAKVLAKVKAETGLDTRAAYTMAMREFAKKLGIKIEH